MYLGPLHLMMPNYVVPAINDEDAVSLTSNVQYYEVAYDEYPEEASILDGHFVHSLQISQEIRYLH